MKPHGYTSLSDVTNLLSKSCLCSEKRKDSPSEHIAETFNKADMDESLDFEEVFTDHILMDKRLRKTLYAGSFFDLDDLPDHPPIALTGLAVELFSKAVPNYGLDVLDMDYVSAASEAARISPCAMIIAMIYLERLQLANSEYLEGVSPPGLFVVTMLVASKFLFEDEEDIATNQMWAEALNFEIKDLNALEREFLSAIDWKVFVDSSEYLCHLENVEKVIAFKQSSLRDWLSYSDVYVLCQDPDFSDFWKSFLKKVVKDTFLWTISYATTALVLYSTTLALQKLSLENNVRNLTIPNDTISIQNSTLDSLHSLYISNEISGNAEVVDKVSHSILKLDVSDERNTYFVEQNMNCYSKTPDVKKKTSPLYTVETLKLFSPQTFRINSNYFMLETPLLNASYFNRDRLICKKSLCSVLMR